MIIMKLQETFTTDLMQTRESFLFFAIYILIPRLLDQQEGLKSEMHEQERVTIFGYSCFLLYTLLLPEKWKMLFVLWFIEKNKQTTDFTFMIRL